MMKTLVSSNLPSSGAIPSGKLASIPDFDSLRASIPDKCARECYLAVHETVTHLGRAMQLGRHRLLIDRLNHFLDLNTLEAVASICRTDAELCTAFSVYFTTLEQAYHWPRADAVSTPTALHDHKLVIQMLYHAELRDVLDLNAFLASSGDQVVLFSENTAGTALRIAKSMIRKADLARKNDSPLHQKKQDRVNLLYRTCSQDWFIQGDYDNHQSHKEFGRLHDVIRTNGTQRSVQEIFETRGLHHLQMMPSLLSDLPSTTARIISVLDNLQIAVTLAREELFNMVVDEVVWGQTFAKFSKPVGFSNIGSGGADCPMFRMLDALCGRVDSSSKDMLLTELDMRSRHFPPNMRSLIHAVAAAPSIRSYVASEKASDELTHRFKALQQLMWDLYEMHRKKALRIVLSLRAGQLFTSSGTQNAKSPEGHICNSLRSAMNVRFGTDPLTRQIPAYGFSTPLLRGSDGTIQAATIRLVLATPLLVGPGDTVGVTVEVKPGELQTRTYSVTEVLKKDKSATVGDFQSATSVEICCRKAGQVSSYLCSQKGQFPIQITLQPKPQFRINGNSNSAEQTIFIAQGSAIGLFHSWLSGRSSLVGKYLLVVGARNLSMLAYADQLCNVLDKFKPNMRVLVSLSQATPEDKVYLGARGIEVFSGRVTSYLQSNTLPVARATFVCGSSEFGLNVARCLNQRHTSQAHALGPRLSSIRTSSLPDLRMHVASRPKGSALETAKLPSISKAELALHNSPGDAWISIGHTVYDISALFSFHPGGEKTLMCRAGLDADGMFNAVHEGSLEVASMLEQMAVGTLATASMEHQKRDKFLDNIVQIQNDLTNTSRFEQQPTGCSEQLSKAPPIEVIRGSLTQLVRGWTELLGVTAVSDTLVNKLQSALDDLMLRWDRKQTALYTEHLYDVERCALGVREIFDSQRIIVQGIHAAVDNLKEKLFASADDKEIYDISLFEMATTGILQSLETNL
ncbi:hypothetical protein QQS21_011464 [Conoideocrella luteorostrata]|uniref:Cytochrome b5 heme-binding domain-containing protein n=1 Tax=Conoideocrella luteorostrata TaxID=1105319 RepID=A0AAJ0CE49_9HYPO|nr:hypothetical protein QQS21_011464 [Conoideocrella luteorostrata]